MRRLNLMMRDLVMMHRLVAEAPEVAKLLLRMQARLVDDDAAGFCPVCMDPDGDASQIERGHLVDCALATVLKEAGLARGARQNAGRSSASWPPKRSRQRHRGGRVR